MASPETFWNMGPEISANRPNLVSLGSKHPNPGIRSLFMLTKHRGAVYMIQVTRHRDNTSVLNIPQGADVTLRLQPAVSPKIPTENTVALSHVDNFSSRRPPRSRFSSCKRDSTVHIPICLALDA